MASIVTQSAQEPSTETADIEQELRDLKDVIHAHRETLASLHTQRGQDEAHYAALKTTHEKMGQELDGLRGELAVSGKKRGELIDALDRLLQSKMRLESRRDAARVVQPVAPPMLAPVDDISISDDDDAAAPAPAQTAPIAHSFDAGMDDERTTTFSLTGMRPAPDGEIEIDMHVQQPVRAEAPNFNSDIALDVEAPKPAPMAFEAEASMPMPTPMAMAIDEPPAAATVVTAALPLPMPAPANVVRTAPPRAAAAIKVAPAAAPVTSRPPSVAKAPAAAATAPLRMAPPMPKGQIRSVQPRVPLCVDVEMSGENNFYMGFSENISEGGLFVATYTPRPVGDRLMLSFTLPNQKQPITCEVEVAWHLEARDVMAHDKDRVPGMGMRFLDLSDEDRNTLLEFVRRREPMFFPG